MDDEKKNIYIRWWLLLVTFLVAIMIIVGGLTRLTDSGLSITKWDLFTGILPPLTKDKWNFAFSLYKEIPEYKILNSSMTLEDFKSIYWWEFAHRLLGRLIGIVYLIPLLFFTFKKILNVKRILSLYLIFVLICFQGIIGWYMVKSGLSEGVDVSHFRLSIHLTIAFIIFVLLLWNYLKFSNFTNTLKVSTLPLKLHYTIFLLILLQIFMGALVSGLDAGLIYKSWPLMNSNYFPDDSKFIDLLSLRLFETPSLVQFLHRNLAYFIFALFIIIFYLVFKNNSYSHLNKVMLSFLLILILQIALGVLTILSGAQILLASMHQIGSIFLVSVSVVLIFKNSETS